MPTIDFTEIIWNVLTAGNGMLGIFALMFLFFHIYDFMKQIGMVEDIQNYHQRKKIANMNVEIQDDNYIPLTDSDIKNHWSYIPASETTFNKDNSIQDYNRAIAQKEAFDYDKNISETIIYDESNYIPLDTFDYPDDTSTLFPLPDDDYIGFDQDSFIDLSRESEFEIDQYDSYNSNRGW